MSVILFNYAEYVANPQFAAYKDLPEPTLQLWWDVAINYISDSPSWGCEGLSVSQREYAIQLMMSHLQYLNAINGGGQVPGLVQDAAIDKVRVGLVPPPLRNQWQWWLSLSPYGQLLYALLQVNSVGGQYIGGMAALAGFRR